MNRIQKLNTLIPSELTQETLSSPLSLFNQKKFKCLTCSRFFSSKHCLTEHGYRHSGQRVYSCNSCKKTFKYASQLSLHKKSHTAKNELHWPKLTDLLNPVIEKEIEYADPTELNELPMISAPRQEVLPELSTIKFSMIMD